MEATPPWRRSQPRGDGRRGGGRGLAHQLDGGGGDALVVVGAHLEGEARGLREQLVAVELRLVGDLVDLLGELAHLGDDRVLVGGVERVVLVLHLQVAHSLQHRVDLVEGAFRRLDQRHAVLRVALSLGEATDLGAHLLGDGQAGGVVGRAVDAVAGRQLLHRLGSLGRGARQLAVGVESLNVVLDTKAHDHLSLMNWFVGGRGDSMSPLTGSLIGPDETDLNRPRAALDVRPSGVRRAGPARAPAGPRRRVTGALNRAGGGAPRARASRARARPA